MNIEYPHDGIACKEHLFYPKFLFGLTLLQSLIELVADKVTKRNVHEPSRVDNYIFSLVKLTTEATQPL